MIIGHRKVQEELLDMVKGNRLPHGILLEGPEHVGKQKVLFWLAKKILCPTKKENCDCPSCRQFDSENHPDFHCVNVEGEKIKKDDIESQFGDFYVQPYEGNGKVFVVLEAHRMSELIQNKMLKRLEEPPENTYILLHTSKKEAMLPTILSRLYCLHFGFVSFEEMKQYLIEEKGKSEGIAEEISKGAKGLPGILFQLIEEPEMLELEKEWVTKIEFFLSGNRYYFPMRKYLMDRKKDFPFLMDRLSLYLRDVILYKNGIGSLLYYEENLKQIRRINLLQAEEALNYISSLEEMMKCNVGFDLIIDNLLIKLQEVYL